MATSEMSSSSKGSSKRVIKRASRRASRRANRSAATRGLQGTRRLAPALAPALALASLLAAAPAFALDSDGDGLQDFGETQIHGTDPHNPDTDGDTLLDGFEVQRNLDPLDPDMDDDELSDGFEVEYQFDPRNPDENANGKLDRNDDRDGDGLGNAFEIGTRTVPIDPDSDDDGLLDGEEVATAQFGPPRAVGSATAGSAALCAADIDGDGDIDVVGGGGWGDSLVWYENLDERGSYGAAQDLPSPPVDYDFFPTTPWLGYVAVVARDFDGDGDLDLVGASRYASLSWFENLDGLGSFIGHSIRPGAPMIGFSESTSGEIAVADFDGDGDLDFATATLVEDVTILNPPSSRLEWYENTDGQGEFAPFHLIAASGARHVSAADLDGDDDADLLATTTSFTAYPNFVRTSKVGWLENDSVLPGFVVLQTIATTGDSLGAASAVDLDGDGDLDVAAASDRSLHWFENVAGDGSFGTKRVLTSAPFPERPVEARFFDADGDGDLDAAVTTSDGRIVLAQNPGLSDVAWSQREVFVPSLGPEAVVPADLDGDGDDDLLIATRTELVWLENLNLGDPLDADSDDDNLGDAEEVQQYGTSATHADTDGDTLDDYAELRIHRTDPVDFDTDDDGLHDGAELHTYQTDPRKSDTDGDGLRDGFEVAAGFDPLQPGEESQDSDSDGLVNLDEQTLQADPWNPDSDGDGLTDGDEANVLGTSPLRADSDADQLIDSFEVAYGFDPLDPDEDANGRVDARDDSDDDWLGNEMESRAGTDPTNTDSDEDGLADGAELASGVFGPRRLVSPTESYGFTVIGTDLDGNGLGDVLTDHTKLVWHRNVDGSGRFAPYELLANEPGALEDFWSADIDGDGDPDLLAVWSPAGDRLQGALSWYENIDGLGHFGPERRVSNLAEVPRAVATADVDGDGDRDVLLAPGNARRVGWLENRGKPGEFAPLRTVATDLVATRLDAADLDGDGDADLVVANYSELRTFENLDGKGSFDDAVMIKQELSGGPVALADLDSDGDVDLLLALWQGRRIIWLPNLEGTGQFVGERRVADEVEFTTFLQPLDMDGDGALDVLFATEPGTVAWSRNLAHSGQFAEPSEIHDELHPRARLTGLAALDIDGDGDSDVVAASGRLNISVAWFQNLNVADPLDPDTDGDGILDGEDDCVVLPEPTCVPEPSPLLLCAIALLCLAALARRRRARSL